MARTNRKKDNPREEARGRAASLVRSGGGKASEPAIAEALEASGMDPRVAGAMAREARESAASGRLPPPPAPKGPEEAILSARDLAVLRGMAKGLRGGEFPLLCSMLLCLRARPHPSGRIRYSDRELIGCAGHLTSREYRRDFASLHDAGLVSCAVVGSKEPTATLSLPWAPEPPSEGEPTEAVPFAPHAGRELAARLAKEETHGR